jgi:ribosomal protein S3AE
VTDAIREQVWEALGNAKSNGYLSDLLHEMTEDEVYVDLCDCTSDIMHLPKDEVMKTVKEWRQNELDNEAEAAYQRHQERLMEDPPPSLLEQQREAQKLK